MGGGFLLGAGASMSLKSGISAAGSLLSTVTLGLDPRVQGSKSLFWRGVKE